MSIEAEGTIAYQSFGMGVWALTTRDVTYELLDPPQELQQAGLSVKVMGQVRDDVMTIAMIGPVLEVNRFEILGV
ncbi:hypothetical protein [Acaryochloris sp. IP29b_bin.148]|uniref:hypothetical protein n=1 Tax=Acaryochloris sp. IP29b_bin.148 TaxID=2969218 RepID=UPI002628C32F|nr:hypothetical protein [Acaryochloris sp. IP29b_bin.148]